ncbi:hypothetical protein BX666DRAFT_1533324 [Dichotomocladium elegans]|nr:hypothetical protein BX666DRAFT_1533324 [Dichotomocladium elegans]
MYEPLGSLDLRDATGVRPSRIRTFAFQIMNNKRRQLMLIADSEVSRKEWMDELQRAVFMARNSGTSVRLVMPFSKIEKLNKTAAYNFAQYIRTSMLRSVGYKSSGTEGQPFLE